MPALMTVASVAAVAAASAIGAGAPLFTLAATRACLASLPDAVAGLPPATPPVPPALFVYAPAHDDVSTAGIGRRHDDLVAWSGNGRYEGVILSFFASVPAARASLRPLAGSSGGKLVRNVVVTRDQGPTPGRSVRNAVLGCLRSRVAHGSGTAAPPPPAATLATFAGSWGGHTRGLSITPGGRGREDTDDGCCTRVYRLTFRILSVSGTLTRATAVYRVTSFRRYERGVRILQVGDVGELLLRNGIVTNTLTGDLFCSDPAWGATGACGA